LSPRLGRAGKALGRCSHGAQARQRSWDAGPAVRVPPRHGAPAADARRARAGWQQAVRVSAAVDAYYPIGAAACCTPALLLATGDAWCVARRGAQAAPCRAAADAAPLVAQRGRPGWAPCR